MTSIPAVPESGPPRVVALLDVLFVVLLFLLEVGDPGPRQPPVRLPSSRFQDDGVHGPPRMAMTVHHGPEEECGRYRRSPLREDRDHGYGSANGVPPPARRRSSER